MTPTNIFRTKRSKPPKTQYHPTVFPPPPPDDADIESHDESDKTTSISVTRKTLPSSSPSSTGLRTIHVKPKESTRTKKEKKEESKPEFVAPGTKKILVKPGPNSSSGIKAVKRRRKKKKGGRKTKKRSK